MSIALRPSCRVIGKPAKALAVTLPEISGLVGSGRDHDGPARRTIRRGNHQSGAERPVLKTPPKSPPETGGNAGLGSAAFGVPQRGVIASGKSRNNQGHPHARRQSAVGTSAWLTVFTTNLVGLQENTV